MLSFSACTEKKQPPIIRKRIEPKDMLKRQSCFNDAPLDRFTDPTGSLDYSMIMLDFPAMNTVSIPL